jgi:hypothetical protein
MGMFLTPNQRIWVNTVCRTYMKKPRKQPKRPEVRANMLITATAAKTTKNNNNNQKPFRKQILNMFRFLDGMERKDLRLGSKSFLRIFHHDNNYVEYHHNDGRTSSSVQRIY